MLYIFIVLFFTLRVEVWARVGGERRVVKLEREKEAKQDWGGKEKQRFQTDRQIADY